MKTIIIDNYDSFTYNLVHYIEDICHDRPTVVKNDLFDLDFLDNFDIIVLSPGPGLPHEAGLLMEVIKKYHKSKIILGVCLGHQAIAEYFGGQLENLEQVHHGVDCELLQTNDTILYKDIQNFNVGRYHSWVVSKMSFPSDLEITSFDRNKNIMSLKHKSLPIHCVQFHPESILSPEGKKLLTNFFNYYEHH